MKEKYLDRSECARSFERQCGVNSEPPSVYLQSSHHRVLLDFSTEGKATTNLKAATFADAIVKSYTQRSSVRRLCVVQCQSNTNHNYFKYFYAFI